MLKPLENILQPSSAFGQVKAGARHVMAVAGTHGKTTTTSMLTWILEANGLQPGFLVGGVPLNFGVSARLGNGDCFVIEADEYDTAFFDKEMEARKNNQLSKHPYWTCAFIW